MQNLIDGIHVANPIKGINFVMQYFALMFEQQYGWEDWLARLLAGSAATAFLIASFVSVSVIDGRCGRRSLMLFGTSGMLVSMIVCCIMLFVNTRVSLDVGTAFIMLYCVFFAIGWQGMGWLYQVEIVPLRVRGPGNAMSTVVSTLCLPIFELSDSVYTTSADHACFRQTGSPTSSWCSSRL